MPHETKPIDYQIKTRRATTLSHRRHLIWAIDPFSIRVIMYAFILFNVYAYQHTHKRTHIEII